MMKRPLFIESLDNHQKLIDILLAHESEEGICEIPEEDLLIAMNRSLGWVKRAIDRINTEDLCIEIIGRNRYIVHYKELAKRGVFNVILIMMLYTMENIDIVRWKNDELMQQFGCKLKTVQMYRSYCTTGWLQGTKDEK